MRFIATTDEHKFGLLAMFMAGLIAATLATNVFLGDVITGISEYVGRRWHYEKLIVPKGLTLHEGKYWREKK